MKKTMLKNEEFPIVREGTVVLDTHYSSKYLIAQVAPNQYQLISCKGNRFMDKKLSRNCLEPFLKSNGFVVLHHKGVILPWE